MRSLTEDQINKDREALKKHIKKKTARLLKIMGGDTLFVSPNKLVNRIRKCAICAESYRVWSDDMTTWPYTLSIKDAPFIQIGLLYVCKDCHSAENTAQYSGINTIFKDTIKEFLNKYTYGMLGGFHNKNDAEYPEFPDSYYNETV